MKCRQLQCFMLVCAATVLLGYGYGPDQDPLITDVKRLAADARSGRWKEAEISLRRLEPSLSEIRTVLGISRDAPLRKAILQRNGPSLARELVILASLAIELKFESSRREKLSLYYAAKYRIEAARGYYMELLAPAVRRHDALRGSDLHSRIWGHFDAARAALGRPGFLGRGVVEPDAERFDAAARRISADLREAFPFLREVIP